MNFDKGIYYIYDNKIMETPKEFKSKNTSRFLGAVELLTRYEHAYKKLGFIVDWLEINRDENNKWDLSNIVNDKVYFPLSDDWRKKENRENDCTERIENILSKININKEGARSTPYHDSIIECVWEHNGEDSILYSANYIGAFARGETKEIALSKIEEEVKAYLHWKGENIPSHFEIKIIQEYLSNLNICEADTDVLFEKEKEPLTLQEYQMLKDLVLKSANDFLILYNEIPYKHTSNLIKRNTFIGPIPTTAYEMYEHTKCVNKYYFGEIGVSTDNEGNIYECRKKGFDLLEKKCDFLDNKVYIGMFNEKWSLRKVLRRFIWHDRIHAKAMYRMAIKTFGQGTVNDIFKFYVKG